MELLRWLEEAPAGTSVASRSPGAGRRARAPDGCAGEDPVEIVRGFQDCRVAEVAPRSVRGNPNDEQGIADARASSGGGHDAAVAEANAEPAKGSAVPSTDAAEASPVVRAEPLHPIDFVGVGVATVVVGVGVGRHARAHAAAEADAADDAEAARVAATDARAAAAQEEDSRPRRNASARIRRDPPPAPSEEEEEEEEEEVEEEVKEEEAPAAAPEPAAPKSPPARRRVPIREMKAALAAAGLDASHCVEREDLEALYGTVGKRPRIEITEEREDEEDEDDDDPPSGSSLDLFDSLPTEVNELILRELSPRSLAAATGVSRAWRDAAGDDELWAAHLARAPRFSTKNNAKPVPFPSTSAGPSGRARTTAGTRVHANVRRGSRARPQVARATRRCARCDLRDRVYFPPS